MKVFLLSIVLVLVFAVPAVAQIHSGWEYTGGAGWVYYGEGAWQQAPNGIWLYCWPIYNQPDGGPWQWTTLCGPNP